MFDTTLATTDHVMPYSICQWSYGPRTSLMYSLFNTSRLDSVLLYWPFL